MAALIILLLIGLLIGQELVRAYYGPGQVPAPYRRMRWVIYLALVVYGFVLLNQIQIVLKTF